MLLEIIKSVAFAGLPVGIASYFLVKIARNETGSISRNTKEIKKQLKEKDVKIDGFWKSLLYKKWMKFGGGFYGVVAFITYLHIEFYEVIDFFQSFFSTDSMFIKIILMLFVEFFVDSIINLFFALLWPVYWPSYLPIESYFLWLGIVIVCYFAGTRIAMYAKTDNTKFQK